MLSDVSNIGQTDVDSILYEIPFVALESENDIKTAHQEVWKLALLNLPVKVLVVPDPGPATLFGEDQGCPVNGREGYLTLWSYVLEELRVKHRPANCVYGVLFLDWSNPGNVTAHSAMLSETGQVLRPPTEVECKA